MRYVQHKKEAFWFYRFLSIFYDKLVNPFFWTESMRDSALELADLNSRSLLTVDVGSGTGFTTQGIARQVNPKYIFCIDQSPHQMGRARQKPDLKGCTFQLGDAENLPFDTDQFDRYVSAGSIEYWPDPQQGIAEAHRVIKPGGVALMIGPLRPQNRLARFLADTWMLFPEEDEYVRWFEKAGFTEINIKYVAPNWVHDEKYGVAICGKKTAAGHANVSGTELKAEKTGETGNLTRFLRLLIGSLAGFFFIPGAVIGYLRQYVLRFFGKATPEQTDRFNIQQTAILLVILTLFILILIWIF
jgi:MPBQ/MSBQ methyltransferase